MQRRNRGMPCATHVTARGRGASNRLLALPMPQQLLLLPCSHARHTHRYPHAGWLVSRAAASWHAERVVATTNIPEAHAAAVLPLLLLTTFLGLHARAASPATCWGVNAVSTHLLRVHQIHFSSRRRCVED
jgi:hypothetical protein